MSFKCIKCGNDSLVSKNSDDGKNVRWRCTHCKIVFLTEFEKVESKGSSVLEIRIDRKKLQKILEDKEEYVCPITQELFLDPVQCMGVNFERKAIVEWTQNHGDRHPTTGVKMKLQDMVTTDNLSKRSEVNRYKEKICNTINEVIEDFLSQPVIDHRGVITMKRSTYEVVENLFKRAFELQPENSRTLENAVKCYRKMLDICHESRFEHVKSCLKKYVMRTTRNATSRGKSAEILEIFNSFVGLYVESQTLLCDYELLDFITNETLKLHPKNVLVFHTALRFRTSISSNPDHYDQNKYSSSQIESSKRNLLLHFIKVLSVLERYKLAFLQIRSVKDFFLDLELSRLFLKIFICQKKRGQEIIFDSDKKNTSSSSSSSSSVVYKKIGGEFFESLLRCCRKLYSGECEGDDTLVRECLRLTGGDHTSKSLRLLHDVYERLYYESSKGRNEASDSTIGFPSLLHQYLCEIYRIRGRMEKFFLVLRHGVFQLKKNSIDQDKYPYDLDEIGRL